MFNLDEIANENSKEHNEKWPYIPDYSYRILIIGGSGSGETNALPNLIKQQAYIDEIYLYVKDLIEPTYKFLIKKPEDAGIKHLFTCIYLAVLYFCSKRCQIKFKLLFVHENLQHKRVIKYCN